jgi:transcriptional regulator with XRE-family HTH domain
MTDFPKWAEVRAGIIDGAGGEEAIAGARRHNQAYIDGHRLSERRKALDLTQSEVADRMGVTKSRVSQIERGEISTIEAVARYVQALGGQLQISAVFGDDLYILRGTDPTPRRDFPLLGRRPGDRHAMAVRGGRRPSGL